MGRYGVLKTAPVESEIAPHAVSDMYRIVVKTRRRAVRILDVVEERVLVRSAPRTVGHLESAVLPDAVTVRMKCNECVRDVADRNPDRQDVHRDALRVEDDAHTLGDVEVDLDLGDSLPLRAGLRDQASQLVGGLVALPVAGLDRHPPRPPRNVLWNRDAKGSGGIRRGCLNDHAAGRRCGRPRIGRVVGVGADLPERRSGRDEIRVGGGTEDRTELELSELDSRESRVRDDHKRREHGGDRDGRGEGATHPRIVRPPRPLRPT